MTRTVQIRDVPDHIHRELRTRAADAGLSLSAYLLRELEQIASRPLIADVLSREVGRGSGVTSRDIVEAIRSSRDSDWRDRRDE